MRRAKRSGMAAIMALVFVPALAAIGFMVMGNAGGTTSAVFATFIFTALAAGVFGGMAKLARGWEEESPN
jgi:hypothetical protein